MNLRQVLVYFCFTSVVVIIIPLLLLDKFWYAQPQRSTGIFFIPTYTTTKLLINCDHHCEN